jgi:predicted aldo/keto reductase-like oxidoreductase
MIYRRFGRTNLQMPVLSCGGMRYQQSWTDLKPGEDAEPANQANLEATIRRAIELGINHIETARGYGSSEVQLGRILPTLPRDKMIIQTKVSPFADPKQFVDVFNTSMKQLKLGYVDLLGLHGINNPEKLRWATRPGGCLHEARKLQKEGRVRWVGFSTHGSTQVILDTINHADDGGFDYVNLHWYYIFQRNWAAIEAATKRDMGVFIISPSDKGGKLYAPPKKLVDLTAPLHPIEFNNVFCLSRPQVHTLSIGAARPSDFDLHIQSLKHLPQAAGVLPAIEKKLEAAMSAATGAASPEAITAGLPEFTQSPNEVNLHIILWLRALVKGWDMHEYAKMRYNLLGSGGDWFPGQNVAKLEGVTPDAFNKAVAKSPHAAQVRKFLDEAGELMGGEQVKRLSAS